MLQRLREHFAPPFFSGMHGERNSLPSISYEDIAISDRAKQILQSRLDRQTLVAILDSFRSLSESYQAPELMVERLAQKPVLKITKGFNLSPLTSLVDYCLEIPFDPTQRESGECGEITRWFLYDMQSANISEKLAQKKLQMRIARGQSPLFFNTEGANHVIACLGDTKGKWEILFDPSFGNIVSADENTGYVIKGKDNVQEVEGLLKRRIQKVYGWEKRLENGARAPKQGGPQGPPVRMLGLEKGGERCYGLGFESQNDRPFICVTYANSRRQDILWYDEALGDKNNIGIMSSDSSAVLEGTYEFTDELVKMLDLLKRFQFEESTITDPRLKGEVFF